MSASGEKSADFSEGCAASTPNSSKDRPSTSSSLKDTAPLGPSVKPKTTKGKTTKGKERANPKETRTIPKQQDVVNSRLDKLESMLEKLVSNMLYYDEPDGDRPANVNDNDRVTLGFDGQQVHVPGRGLEDEEGEYVEASEDLSTSVEGKSKPLGFASKFAGPLEEGAPIDSELASSITYLLSNKLEEKQMTDTAQKYLRPSNCETLLVPKVNPVIWDNLSLSSRNVDVKMQRCQKPLVKGITALIEAFKDRSAPLSEAEQDGIALLCNAVFELNIFRKELIKPELNKRYSHLCKPSVTPTQWLFGDDLQKTVKELDEQQKAVGAIRPQRARFGFHPYRQDSRRKYADAGWIRKGSRPFLGVRHQTQNPPRRPYVKQNKSAAMGKPPSRI